MVEVKQMDTVSYFQSILRRLEEEFGAYGVSFCVHMDSVLSDLSIQADWKEGVKKWSSRYPFEHTDGQFSFDYDRATHFLKRSLELTGGGDDA